MLHINYHHLQYFLRIAELGSVSQAAVELRLGQPTLSAQLKALEEQLGLLFDRKGRRLVLTERGRLVLQYAREIFSKGDELKTVIQRGELAPAREIVVGAQDGVPKAILAATLLRIQKVTQARLKIIEGDAGHLLEEVLKGHVDFLVTDHELSSGLSLVYLPVAHERLAVWGTEAASKSAVKFPKNLNGRPFVAPTLGHPVRSQMERFFLENQVSPVIVMEAPDTALVKELGAQGAGLIVLGETTVRSWVRAGRLKRLGLLPFEQTYWLGLPKKALKDPQLEGIVHEFKKSRA